MRHPILLAVVLGACLFGLFEERLGLLSLVGFAGVKTTARNVTSNNRGVFASDQSMSSAESTTANSSSDEAEEAILHRHEGGVQIHITHLYNPYRVVNCEDPFCPYDQAQSVAMASMKRAQAKAHQQQQQETKDTDNNTTNFSPLSVVLTAVTYPDEIDIIPNGFVALDPLTRSTATQYPNMTIKGRPRRLPFWQDMLQSLLARGEGGRGGGGAAAERATTQGGSLRSHLVVYTNSDIVLHEDFYLKIYDIYAKQGRQCFSINRQTISKENVTTRELYTGQDLDDIFQLPTTARKEHPGYDCFVFTWDVATTLDLGDVFVGYPPLGMAILAQLLHYSRNKHNNNNNSISTSSSSSSSNNQSHHQQQLVSLKDRSSSNPFPYQRFLSHEIRMTFHLGCDTVWKGDKEHDAFIEVNERNGEALTQAPWNSIPWSGGKPKRLRNNHNSNTTRKRRIPKTC